MEFDAIFGYIGEFGVYQIVLFALLGIVSFYPGYQSISITFLAGSQEHWCKIDRLENFTFIDQRYIAIPYDSNGNYDRCGYYNHNYNNYTDEQLANRSRNDYNDTEVLKCDSWVYDQSEFYSTLVSEWDLVCDNSGKVSLLSTAYLAGIFVGAPMSGACGDRFGRFPTLISTTFLHFVFALAGAFAPNYIAFNTFRFIMSVFDTAANLTAFIIIMEVIGPRYRTMAGVVFQLHFAVGFMTLPCIAYFVRDWEKLSLTLAMPILCSCGYYWLVPESPRWLLSTNKTKEALQIVKNIAAINGRALPGDINISNNEGPEVKKGTFMDILRHPLLRKELLIMYLAWFTNSLVYFGLSLNTSTLAGSVYVNTFISGAVEIPANLICIWALYVVGRRLSLAVGFIVGGVACLLCIPFLNNDDLGWLVTTLTMIGKAAITLTFSVVYVYTAELFPTPVRQLAVGSSSMMARVSALMSPYMGEPLMNVWTPLPSLLFGLFSVMSGVLSFMLPETLGKKLPDTIEDAEEIGMSNKKSKGHQEKKNTLQNGSQLNSYDHYAVCAEEDVLTQL